MSRKTSQIYLALANVYNLIVKTPSVHRFLFTFILIGLNHDYDNNEVNMTCYMFRLMTWGSELKPQKWQHLGNWMWITMCKPTSSCHRAPKVCFSKSNFLLFKFFLFKQFLLFLQFLSRFWCLSSCYFSSIFCFSSSFCFLSSFCFSSSFWFF